MPSNQSKQILCVVIVILVQVTPMCGQLNLYNTEQQDMGVKDRRLDYDCLDYYVYRKKAAQQGMFDVSAEVIPYCIRSTDVGERPTAMVAHPLARRLSFEEASSMGISSEQLWSWSVSIETLHRYQDYLENGRRASLNAYFYNCTPGWFGTRCQYSFDYDLYKLSFNEIVDTISNSRLSYAQESEFIPSIPCYVFVECHRQGRIWCLDWREVCDGVVDCFDEGVDEQNCFAMEVNECDVNEYRCHNGLCISEELWESGTGEAECLDRSDELEDVSYPSMCYRDLTFRCEEHSCRPTYSWFSCGDGECVGRFQSCHSGRHLLLIESIMDQGDLEHQCWLTMLCLTKLLKQINGIVCEVWLATQSVNELLENCDTHLQFPTLPVYSNHVRLFYENVSLRDDLNMDFVPDYVCHDSHLCDSISGEAFSEQLRCRRIQPSTLTWYTLSDNPWSDMVYQLGIDFRKCLSSAKYAEEQAKHLNRTSLCHCNNSRKSISSIRFMDNMIDCFDADDEDFNSSCLLDHHRHRVKCGNASKSWSPIVKKDACLLSNEQSVEDLPFRSFCDGIEAHFYYDSTRQWRSEEDGCDQTLCDNIYARCDGYWACSDGRDEWNCTEQICPVGRHACISPANYKVYCLPQTSVNDRLDDCVGATDEQKICREVFQSDETLNHLRCLQDNDTCIGPSQLCNKVRDCAFGEDEGEFCENPPFTCQKNASHKRSVVEQILCEPNEVNKKQIRYFSVHTSPIYPALPYSFIDETMSPLVEQDVISLSNILPMKLDYRFHHCYRGVPIKEWAENTLDHSWKCLCPASYYGEQCEFQNQRVSLTLRVSSDDRYATYGVVSMLLDNDTAEIIAFNQFQYVAKDTCAKKFSHYFLFPTRPKNTSRNYSIRVDVIEKNRMAYVGHWHYPISFLFLPVNRMGISLNLTDPLLQTPSTCPIRCADTSECVKYVNKERYFCRCPPSASTSDCYKKMHCHRCSSGSICIGSTRDEPICVCPLSKQGRRCSQSTNCSHEACENDGQCVWNDRSVSGSNYTCVCSERYFGLHCEYKKWRLDVSFSNLKPPSHLIAYFFTLSNQSDPTNTIVLRKLTLFQRTVTFYISTPFQLALIRIHQQYYRAFLQHSPKLHTRTVIEPQQACPSVNRFFNATVLELVAYERIIYFHKLCRERRDVICFVDDKYFCLCTNDRHANCMPFKPRENFECASKQFCRNDAQCFQDHPTCPSTKICICPTCFFGKQCQLYARGIGSTLDEILGYEFERQQPLHRQPFSVQLSAGITMLIFVVGTISSVLSIMTFSQVKARENGSGLYLMTSSVTSLLTVSMLMLKFWLLSLSYRRVGHTWTILVINCRCIEMLLKVFLYMNGWMNACVAGERTYAASTGLHFDKFRSRRIALIATPCVCIITAASLIPQMIFLHVFKDDAEERTWCVISYKGWLKKYNLAISLFHYCIPLAIQIISTIYIIITTARQRSASQADRSFLNHLKRKVYKYKQLLISPLVIIALTLPNLVLALVLDCKKESHFFWLHLIGYYLSFMPAASVFIIFISPSPLYRKQLQLCVSHIRRRIRTY